MRRCKSSNRLSLVRSTPSKNECKKGYKADASGICIDIDECNETGADCPEKSNCRNTDGSYACDCHSGYAGAECKNVDECANSNPCGPNSQCKDTDGSYECPCITGFYPSGSICVNVDECTEGTHGCPLNSKCSDTIGSYECECNTGYAGESCLNINECTAGTHSCRKELK